MLGAAAASRRGRGPPRLRLPRRERRLRPGGHRRRADLDRAAAGRDRVLGDKVAARHIAAKVGAPLAPGHRRTRSPARTRSRRSPTEHGLPIAIKAAFGGGGRGLKVARTMEEIAGAVRVGGARGGGGVRPRRVLRRALPGPAAARRDAVPGRPARQRRRGRHPGLLAAAPAPEAGRGGARAVPDRRAARQLTRRPRPSCARPGTSARALSSSWSARTARCRSSRSTPGCRSSTR